MPRDRLPALAWLLSVALSGCCTCMPVPTFTVRKGAALSPGPAPSPPPADALRVLHVGDFGLDSCEQASVASALEAAHRRERFTLAFFDGDDLYWCGPDPVRPGAEACAFAADGNTVATPPAGDADPQFAQKHEGPLAGLAAGIPPPRVLLTLGNHDVMIGGRHCTASGLAPAEAQRRKACLEVAHQSELWSMPARHYVVDQGPARFIAIDTNAIEDYGGFSFDDEVAFVASAAQGCDVRACFLVGHHPAATCGSHAGDGPAERWTRIQALVDAGGGKLRAWLAGHDHDLQHVRTAGGLDVLIAGSSALDEPNVRFDRQSPGATLLFGSLTWGYGVLTVSGASWEYRFENEKGKAVYCCAASGAGRCEPVSCR